MKFKIYTVDAFASNTFEGNPAAVVPLDETVPDPTLQAIASEMNISETCYLTKSSDVTEKSSNFDWKTSNRFGLRWFTPKNEVIMCGHATLAASHVLFNCIGNTSQSLEFETLSGILYARRGKEGKITLDFPLRTPRPLTQQEKDEFTPIVEVIVKGVDGIEVVDLLLSTEAKKLLIRLRDKTTRNQLESLTPDMQSLVDLHDGSVFKGVIVTVAGQRNQNHNELQVESSLQGYHFVSRYFAPWNGIPEDPVTGSAHTVLTPYWAKELNLKTMTARQCSRRGGDIEVFLREDGRVDLSGCARTVIEGTFTVE